jgi:hypothetical protein
MMQDINRLKKLSGLNESVYNEDATKQIEKLIQKINRIPEDLMYFAANLDQSKDSHDILESVAKSLEAAAAKIRS